ncbi:response regulator transcription factor [Jiangella asiatica]|uniref:Response regulator transcription factor n=1 Tax=Jiangella asiatica TaxID=2530372 RepID=A0A4R5DGZ9_9ACTN|nr:response regulator transcription factor [Jiangella asiatica]TDE11191.1 response regulator transcription factor [Jiangella asiatica]
MRVLVVEDERALADMLAKGLRREAMAVDVAYDGDEALEKLAVNDYDVLVLDRDLPGVHGDAVCRTVVERDVRTRILILTAATNLRDRVDGLHLGADDYLGKPFEYEELLARVHALARRAEPRRPPVLEHRGLVVDVARRVVTRDGRRLSLTSQEFAVLTVLVEARGAVVSAEELLERAWDEHADPFTNAVRVCVSKLRAKLGEPLIETVPRAGYRI